MVGQVIRVVVLIAHLLGLSLQLEAQNIVPNGNFEDVWDCPTSGGGINGVSSWSSSSGSPNLFHECGDFGYSVPNNISGFQIPNSGNGYAGIVTYVNFPTFVNAREFLKCTLNYELVQGEEYYVEFYASQSDSAEYATHNLGVTFTTVLSDTGETGYLTCWPDCNDVYIENTSANPLTSKTEWVKVSGTFTAEGGEKFIHIGNFRTDEDSEIEFVGGGFGPEYDWFVASYYIDDVWLSHIDSMGYVGVNEDPSTALRAGLLVYPNPATDVLNVTLRDFSTRSSVEVTVVDFSGREILTSPSPSLQGGELMQLDVSGWSVGIYLLSVRDENGNVVSKRVVKE